MRNDIIKYLSDELKRRCEMPDNFFGIGGFYGSVAKFSNKSILV